MSLPYEAITNPVTALFINKVKLNNETFNF